MLTSICPIMPSQDFGKTIEFYSKLGFETGALYEAEGYLILHRDHIEVHFFKAKDVDPYSSDHGAFVRIDDANELWHHYKTLNLPLEGIPRVTPAEDKPWGICEFAIVDPDGNMLRVGHILPST